MKNEAGSRDMSRTFPMILVMAIAVAVVSALAVWDERRESYEAMSDFANEQATLAEVAATDLDTRLEVIERNAKRIVQDPNPTTHVPPALKDVFSSIRWVETPSPPSRDPIPALGTITLSFDRADGTRIELDVSTRYLTAGIREVERPQNLRLFIRLPGEQQFRQTDGHPFPSHLLAWALDSKSQTLRIDPTDASGLGLPERIAVAGMSRLENPELGSSGVIAVASAERQRERSHRASWRLALTVLLVCALVSGFGGLALRTQRLSEVAELRRTGEERLAKLSRAATTVTLASGMAHELGTPLGVIVGRAEQIVSRAADERSVKSAQVILEQAEHIHQVVAGFLELARGGNPTLERVAPERILRGVIDLVSHRFEQAGLELRLEVPPQRLEPITGDVRLLEHALSNLLLNACDASVSSRAPVVLRAVPASDALRLTVEDQGIGIPREEAARVMEPFFSTKPVGQGTGLGLAVANEIARSHHGSLTLEGNSPRGTRAVLTLPYADGGRDVSGQVGV